MDGYFITFEGGEGAGKSTQVSRLAATLLAGGREIVTTREPGGSPGAEAIRNMLLSGDAEAFGSRMEAMLFAAARRDHIDKVIRPALQRGAIVLCDRFIDSSRVYQGVTGGLDDRFMAQLEALTVDGVMPDLTLIFDLDPEVGAARALARRGDAVADRFEKEALDIHRIRRDAFLRIAAAEPERCVVVNAAGSADEVEAEVKAIVTKRLAAAGPR